MEKEPIRYIETECSIKTLADTLGLIYIKKPPQKSKRNSVKKPGLQNENPYK